MWIAKISWRGSGAVMRVEPPPKVKRRPCGGGVSDFDLACIEMVSMNSWIIRRRRPLYKAAQASSNPPIEGLTGERPNPWGRGGAV